MPPLGFRRLLSIFAVAALLGSWSSFSAAEVVNESALEKELFRLATEFLELASECKLDEGVDYFDIDYLAALWEMPLKEVVQLLKEAARPMCGANVVVGEVKKVEKVGDDIYVLHGWDPIEEIGVTIKFRQHRGEHRIDYKIIGAE